MITNVKERLVEKLKEKNSFKSSNKCLEELITSFTVEKKIQKIQTVKTLATVLETLDTFVITARNSLFATLSDSCFEKLVIPIFSGNFYGLTLIYENIKETFINKHDKIKNCEWEHNKHLSLLINFIEEAEKLNDLVKSKMSFYEIVTPHSLIKSKLTLFQKQKIWLWVFQKKYSRIELCRKRRASLNHRL